MRGKRNHCPIYVIVLLATLAVSLGTPAQAGKASETAQAGAPWVWGNDRYGQLGSGSAADGHTVIAVEKRGDGTGAAGTARSIASGCVSSGGRPAVRNAICAQAFIAPGNFPVEVCAAGMDLSNRGITTPDSSPQSAAPGWPVFLGPSADGQSYTPTLFDIDGDGAAEIFVHGGETFGLRGDGSFLRGWPTQEMQHMSTWTSAQAPGPSVGDFDGDGIPDVLWASHDWYAGTDRTWAFNARKLDGSNVAGFPKSDPVENSLAMFFPFVLGDTNGSGFRAAAAGLVPIADAGGHGRER